jgi:hypothetical protein
MVGASNSGLRDEHLVGGGPDGATTLFNWAVSMHRKRRPIDHESGWPKRHLGALPVPLLNSRTLPCTESAFQRPSIRDVFDLIYSFNDSCKPEYHKDLYGLIEVNVQHGALQQSCLE